MSFEKPATYHVRSLKASSKAGGYPDEVAEKIIRQWNHFEPTIDGAPMSDCCRPRNGYLNKIMASVWTDQYDQASLVVVKENGDEEILDHGPLKHHDTVDNSTSIIFGGHKLWEIRLTCDLNGVEEPAEIPISLPEPGATTASPPPAPSSPPVEPLPLPQPQVPLPQPQLPQRNQTVRMTKKQNNSEEKQIVRMISTRAAELFKVDFSELSKLRDPKIVSCRNAITYVLHSTLKMSASAIQRELFPQWINTGPLYGILQKVREKLAAKDADDENALYFKQVNALSTYAASTVAKTETPAPTEVVRMRQTRIRTVRHSSAQTPAQAQPISPAPESEPADCTDAVLEKTCAFILVLLGHDVTRVAIEFDMPVDELCRYVVQKTVADAKRPDASLTQMIMRVIAP